MSSTACCPACGCPDTHELERVDVAEQHQLYAANEASSRARLDRAMATTADAYQMLRCNGCGLEFASPLKAPPEEWYQAAYAALDLYPARRWEFGKALENASPDDFVVDFGCGAGAFLKSCRDRSIPAVGFDFSDSAIQRCHEQGLDARKLAVDVSSGLSGSRRATLVTAFHVLEHLDAPQGLFLRASQASAANARLWISVPSDRRPSRWFGHTDFLDQPPHHMTRWSERALAAIGERTGWVLRRLHYEPLTLRGTLWSIAAHSPVYRHLAEHGCLAGKTRERMVRWFLYPWALGRRLMMANQLSGFTMLAEFTRSPSP